MKASLRSARESDWGEVAAIFNEYVRDSFAAYPEEPVDASFFRQKAAASPSHPFVVAEEDGRVAGFAFLAPFHTASSFRHTATVTYFIRPGHTGRGIGSAFLSHLEAAGRRLGITILLAHVSSLNGGSLRFHLRHGFMECGRFERVGRKAGREFDVVWFEEALSAGEEGTRS